MPARVKSLHTAAPIPRLAPVTTAYDPIQRSMARNSCNFSPKTFDIAWRKTASWFYSAWKSCIIYMRAGTCNLAEQVNLTLSLQTVKMSIPTWMTWVLVALAVYFIEFSALIQRRDLCCGCSECNYFRPISFRTRPGLFRPTLLPPQQRGERMKYGGLRGFLNYIALLSRVIRDGSPKASYCPPQIYSIRSVRLLNAVSRNNVSDLSKSTFR